MRSQEQVQVSPQSNTEHADLSSLRAELETVRRALATEIHHYPTPIAACDAQFNHLLEQRTLVLAELARLSETETAAASPADAAAHLTHAAAFLNAIRRAST